TAIHCDIFIGVSRPICTRNKRSEIFFFQSNSLPKLVFNIYRKNRLIRSESAHFQNIEPRICDFIYNWLIVHYKNPSSSCASSLIISLSHGGSKVISTMAFFTCSKLSTLASTSLGSDSATGQDGDVSVMS